MIRPKTFVILILFAAAAALAIPTIATYSAAGSSNVAPGSNRGPTQGMADLVAIKTTGLPPSEVWTRQIGTSNSDIAYGIAVDAAGSSYVAGTTGGTLPGQTNAGGPLDAFVRKFDAAGNEAWTRQFGTINDDIATAIAVDAADNIYVAGQLRGITGASNPADAFLRKYDLTGNVVWIREFGTSAFDSINSVAADRAGNIYVAGTTHGTLPGQTSLGEHDAFVRKYDQAGNEIWTRQFGTSRGDIASGIAVDAMDNIYVAGGTLFGSFPGFTNAGGDDAFVRKYDSAGDEVWTRQFGTSGIDRANGIVVDEAGNSFVAGRVSLRDQTGSTGSDAFVRKYDDLGTELWTRQFGTISSDGASKISIDAAGNVYLAGEAGNTIPGQTSAGSGDGFLRRYDPEGNEVWTRQFGTAGLDVAHGVSVDLTGNIFVVGQTSGTFQGQTNLGGTDAFVRKYSVAEVVCAPWTWTITTRNKGAGAASFTSGQTIVLDDLPDSGLKYGTPRVNSLNGITGPGSISSLISGNSLIVTAVGDVTIEADSGFSVSFNATPTAGGTYVNPIGGGIAMVDPDNVITESNEANNLFTDTVTVAACPTPTPTPAAADLTAQKTSGLSTGSEVWTRQFGTSSSDDTSGIAVDVAGNIYITGSTLGTFTGETRAGGWDGFVRKYNAVGNEVWTRQFGTTAFDHGVGIAVDTAGNSYVAGRTDGTFPGQTNSGGFDIFLRKLDTAGNEVWTLQFGTSERDEAYNVATDTVGNVYIVGFTQGGTLPGQTSSGGFDAIVRKYDSAGATVWTRQFGTSGSDVATGITVDTDDRIYIAGRTDGTLPGGSNSGGNDVYVRKYDSLGTEMWTSQFGTSGTDEAYSIAVDPAGNSYISGRTFGIFPGETGAGGANDAYASKIDPAGNVVWTRQFGSSGLESALDIAADSLGNTYVAGLTAGTLPGQTSSGEDDAYVLRFDEAGNLVWRHQFGTSSDDTARSIAVDQTGNIFLTGETAGRMPDQFYFGQRDGFVRKFNTDAISCVAWTWNITTANQGGSNASFGSGQTILLDDLPSSGLTYSSPMVGSLSGISGNLSAAITGNTLTVTAETAVTIAPGGSFTVSFTAKPTADGSYRVPPGSSTSMVDPNNVISESNEANNTFTDIVTVSGCPAESFISLAGQVLTSDGRGLRGATVSLTDEQGVKRTVITSSLGFYSFDDVENGSTVVIAVASKRFRFAPRTLEVSASLSDVDFVGVE